jgi:hypothetical protein
MHDWYIFGAWLMHSLMVWVEVQIGSWLMHLFMVHVGYRLFGQVILTGYVYKFGAWFMHLFMVQVEVQVYVWYMLAHVIGKGCYRLISTGPKQYISH